MAKKKRKRKDPIEKLIPYAPMVKRVLTNDFDLQWCCDCGLRHIVHLRVERGETPEEDVVVLSCCRDEVATKLRRARKRNRRRKCK